MTTPTLGAVLLRVHNPSVKGDGSLAEGLHGSLAWSCHHEHEGYSPRKGDRYLSENGSVICSPPVIAATDKRNQAHLYGIGCVQDIVVNPDAYAGEGIQLHGTHELDDELLAEAQLPGRHSATECYSNAYDGGELVELSASDDDDSQFVVAAVTADGELAVVSHLLFEQLIREPAKLEELGLTLHGTHVLPVNFIADLFGTDED